MFVPSKYQTAIYEKIKTLAPGQNLVIQARAGSGKSTTIVKSLELIPADKNVIFLAFNKAIANDLATKVPFHVQATTLNGFGWGICQKMSPSPRLDQYKTTNILKRLTPNSYKIQGTVSQLVSLAKAWMFESPNENNFLELAEKYGIDLPNKDVLQFAEEVFKLSYAGRNIMDFDDQLFFPMMLDLPTPPCDYVFVDEAQDLNPVQIELVKRLGANGSIIAVGDREQAIYGFRGADPDAMDKLVEQTRAEVLPLSICYRCCKSVIAYAQRIVPDIEHAEEAIEGSITEMSIADMRVQWKDGDYVLCRITAPLVSNCLAMIRQKRRANVKGREIGKNLVDLLNKISKSDSTIPEDINAYRYVETEKLTRLGRDAQVILINDKCDTLLAIWQESRGGLFDMKNLIDQIFADDNAQGIIFSTIHKAKGLEANRIFILEMNLLPHPMAKKAWQKKQEMNLKYVAITRAKEELYLQK